MGCPPARSRWMSYAPGCCTPRPASPPATPPWPSCSPRPRPRVGQRWSGWSGCCCRACARNRADLEAEMLAGLLEAIRVLPADEDRVAGRLLRWALFAGLRMVERNAVQSRREVAVWTSAEPPRPASHPDLVLADAVADGVLTAVEAELVGETRLGGVPLGELADRWGISYQAAKKRRQRAEARLVRWLRARMSPNGG